MKQTIRVCWCKVWMATCSRESDDRGGYKKAEHK